MPSLTAVKGGIAPLVLLAASFAVPAQSRPPIQDSVRLNIGINCRWERSCIAAQQRAMNAALSYVRNARPAAARIHVCNRNASRGRYRVDWIGFNNCIRNATLRIRRTGQLRAMRATVTRA
jgi:hypothetical protein